MKQLKKGDPCRVRLSTGKVVEATYDSESWGVKKDHFVEIRGKPFRATSRPDQSYSIPECRFVGNPCVLVPVEVSL